MIHYYLYSCICNHHVSFTHFTIMWLDIWAKAIKPSFFVCVCVHRIIYLSDRVVWCRHTTTTFPSLESIQWCFWLDNDWKRSLMKLLVVGSIRVFFGWRFDYCSSLLIWRNQTWFGRIHHMPLTSQPIWLWSSPSSFRIIEWPTKHDMKHFHVVSARHEHFALSHH